MMLNKDSAIAMASAHVAKEFPDAECTDAMWSEHKHEWFVHFRRRRNGLALVVVVDANTGECQDMDVK